MFSFHSHGLWWSPVIVFVFNRLLAEKILLECTGNEIWSYDTCRQSGIPEAWIEELQEAYESGFAGENQMIFYQGRLVNQFEGCRDLDLALKLAEYLGIDTTEIRQRPLSPQMVVTRLKEELEEN
jgi:hypothetical protein